MTEFLRLLFTTLFLALGFSAGLPVYGQTTSHWTPVARPSSLAPIDVVVDIDWTIADPIKELKPNFTDANTLQIGDEYFRPIDHLGEIFLYLVANYDFLRLSFFSGGEEERNLPFLQKVKLPDGRSLADISFRIFSKVHLFVASADPKVSYAERYKKIPAHHIYDLNPDNSFAIDDKTEFFMRPKDHPGPFPYLLALRSLGTMTFQAEFDEKMSQTEWFPRNRGEWTISRNRALVWLAAISEALDHHMATGKPVVPKLAEIWGTDDSKALNLLNSSHIRRLADKGATLLREFRANDYKPLRRVARSCRLVVNP